MPTNATPQQEEGNEEVAAAAFPSPLLRVLLPKVGDLIFLAVFVVLVFTWHAAGLLYDASIGWHIRNGDFIRATRAIPRVDHFSYTMAGQTWYSWEWLYDVLLSLVHSLGGLAGVVVLSAALIALTLKLLYERLLSSSHSILVAAVLVLLAGEASSIHYLARPHLVTWLLTVVFLIALERFRAGLPARLWLLPVAMLFWVNLHGGFVTGLAVIGIYLLDAIWSALTADSAELKTAAAGHARRIAAVLAGCLAATFVNPYGYQLHVHVWKFLNDTFLLSHFAEFTSPNFHQSAPRYFEALLILTILSLAFSPLARSFRALLLLLVALHAGLFSVRNLPLASAMLSIAIAPALADSLRRVADHPLIAARMRTLLMSMQRFSSRMEAVEQRLTGYLLPLLAVLFTGVLLVKKDLQIDFSPARVPVKAVDFIQKEGIHDHLATLDAWGGYMIYRLYPEFRVFTDDRGDLFKDQFLREYLSMMYANWNWKKTLDKYSVRWVLVPPDVPLFAVLRSRKDWKVVYDDGFAILFERIDEAPGAAAKLGAPEPPASQPANSRAGRP